MMKLFGTQNVCRVLFIAVAFLLAAIPACASQSDVDFFKGKTITYIVATKPGGGYDTYGRLIAKYLSKHLDATVIVKNVPGAGDIIGANQLFARSRTDSRSGHSTRD